MLRKRIGLYLTLVALISGITARSHLRAAAEGETPLDAAARATLATLNRTISREL